MSNSFDARLAVLLSIAAAAGLLAWLAAHAGSSALSRYRTEFTERTRFQAQEFFLFVDAESGNPKVVYRRKGWSYGVISLSENGEESEESVRAYQPEPAG